MIDIDQLLDTSALLNGRSYLEIFQAVRARISNERHWTQLTFARTAEGGVVKPTDPRATCWCLLGGFAKECNAIGLIPPQILTFLDEMVAYSFGEVKPGKRKFESVGEFNDYASHSEVLSFLDQCIARFT